MFLLVILTLNANYGGLVGEKSGGIIVGRNYQLDDATGTGVNLANDDGVGVSFVLDDHRRFSQAYLEQIAVPTDWNSSIVTGTQVLMEYDNPRSDHSS